MAPSSSDGKQVCELDLDSAVIIIMRSGNEGSFEKLIESGSSGMGKLERLAQKIKKMNGKAIFKQFQIAYKSISLIFPNCSISI